MPLILPGNVASATAAVGYDVANSCRWDRASSPEMVKTLIDGDRQKFTLSWWMKGFPRGVDWNFVKIWPGGGANSVNFRILDAAGEGGQFSFLAYTSDAEDYNIIPTRLFRDPSAWYHIVFAVDTTQGVAASRVRFYVNGTEETAFNTQTLPDQNDNLNVNVADHLFYFGVAQNSTNFADCYFAEVVYIDGTQYAASDLGEFDEDSPTIWKPTDPSGLTFGNNGFYLDFGDSANLGNDANGGTDLTETNLAAADQATDTPTNNFCTMNHLAQVDASGAASSFTFSEGNCKVVGGSPASYVGATMAPSAGKWYYEMKLSHGNTVINMWFGVRSYDEVWGPTGYAEPEGDGTILDGWFWKWGNNGVNTSGASGSDGHVHNDKAGTYTSNATGTALKTDDIVGINLDLDNGDTYLQVNGTDVYSGNTVSDLRVDQGFFYTPIVNTEHASVDTTVACSFGGCPSFAISSAVSDGNGYGNFEYAPKSGYLALCSKNLGSDGG